jgi:hypothetical protein
MAAVENQEGTMRKLGACGLAAALAVGLGTATALAGEEDRSNDTKATTKPSSTWWNPVTWFGPQEKKPEEKKTAPKKEKQTAKKPAFATKAPTVVAEAAAERAREESVLLRRLQVCDKLMEIAVRTNDNDLLRRVEELDERARTAYAQHTAHLGGGLAADLDERILEKHLGGNTEAKKPLPDDDSRRASAKERHDRAALEVGQ